MAEWYYGENGAQVGPLDEHAMRAAIGEGLVHPQTLVWRDGMPNWQPLAGVPELSVAHLPANPGAPPVYYGHGYPMAVRNSGAAVASMVCGIVAWVTCMFLFGLPAIAAVVCGHFALHSIKNSPVPLAGRGMAISGLVMGYLMIFAIISFFVIVIIQGSP